MNLEEFPDDVKKDVEDQSLAILNIIRNDIIVIGGWAVRALAGEMHARYTLDIDGIASEKNMPKIKRKIKNAGLKSRGSDWGIQFYKKYEPDVRIADKHVRNAVNEVELRIELSEPKIKEFQTYHYFEFGLTNYVKREISFHNKDVKIKVNVPPANVMAAVKLGLPVDYKNNFDSAVLLGLCDIDDVVVTIQDNDDWHEMVLRRMPKLKGRINNPGRLENMLSIAAKIDVKDYIQKLEYIESSLRK